MMWPEINTALIAVAFSAWTFLGSVAVVLSLPTLRSLATLKARHTVTLRELRELRTQNEELNSSLSQMVSAALSPQYQPQSDSKPCLCKPSPGSRRRSTTRGTSAPTSSPVETVKFSNSSDQPTNLTWE